MPNTSIQCCLVCSLSPWRSQIWLPMCIRYDWEGTVTENWHSCCSHGWLPAVLGGFSMRFWGESIQLLGSRPVMLPVATCLLLTCFLADRPNVQDQSLVERLQHTYVEALHSYICINRPNVSVWPTSLVMMQTDCGFMQAQSLQWCL